MQTRPGSDHDQSRMILILLIGINLLNDQIDVVIMDVDQISFLIVGRSNLTDLIIDKKSSI